MEWEGGERVEGLWGRKERVEELDLKTTSVPKKNERSPVRVKGNEGRRWEDAGGLHVTRAAGPNHEMKKSGREGGGFNGINMEKEKLALDVLR